MKRNSPGDCSSCEERWFCKKLCEYASWYVGQDYVGMKESPTEFLSPKAMLHVDSLPKLTITELKIARYLVAGLKVVEIAQSLGIKTSSVYPHIHRMKKKRMSM